MSQSYKHILVAVDGSYESELAVEKGIQVALRNGGELILAHVLDGNIYGLAGDGTVNDYTVSESYKHADKVLDYYTELANKEGLTNVKKVVRAGSPRTLLAKVIPEEVEADLLMVGATGLNAFERFMMGSTSEYIMRHTKIDLLVVRNSEKTL
ncbi:universal stress protein [Streptococcus saliviloxodontae]|uniref:Universal stress protein n=1 Tax=Streptococcus saliviloxodontae TaxID=1349416 RepID=A0ABS2PIN3_9STRE|nr:universal stress protein [Streptococcus saliviloxodontae]MBM7635285.1 nucleotide-binding universal stress UspA family protein [Streptococcus saliviloxodontae]